MRRRVRRLGILAGVAALLAGGAYLALQKGLVRFNYPPGPPTFVHGLDVSHHQGVIDWARVPSDEFRFVYIKASEGGDFTDPMFESNWRRAGVGGFQRGAYHFFTFCRPGLDQAAHFLQFVRPEAELPPVVDVEFGGNCRRPPGVDKVRAELRAFIEAVEREASTRVVIYATEEARVGILGEHFADQPLWARDVFAQPDDDDWWMWQYGNRGRVAGIDGPVDLNVVRASPTGQSSPGNP